MGPKDRHEAKADDVELGVRAVIACTDMLQRNFRNGVVVCWNGGLILPQGRWRVSVERGGRGEEDLLRSTAARVFEDFEIGEDAVSVGVYDVLMEHRCGGSAREVHDAVEMVQGIECCSVSRVALHERDGGGEVSWITEEEVIEGHDVVYLTVCITKIRSDESGAACDENPFFGHRKLL